MYCLDTNILIDLLRGNIQTQEKIKTLDLQKLYTNPIIISELFKGVYRSDNSEEKIRIIENLLNSLEILDFNKETYRLYGRIYNELKRQGKPTAEFDLMIACLSMSNNTTLITKNAKDFQNIKELKIIVW